MQRRLMRQHIEALNTLFHPTRWLCLSCPSWPDVVPGGRRVGQWGLVFRMPHGGRAILWALGLLALVGQLLVECLMHFWPGKGRPVVLLPLVGRGVLGVLVGAGPWQSLIFSIGRPSLCDC